MLPTHSTLCCAGLRAGYDGQEKLHGVDLDLAPGRLTAVVGPNGCGKSTLVRCLAGQLAPTGGEITLTGEALSRVNPALRARKIAYMPQSRLVPEISVGQLVLHGRYPHLKWGQRPGAKDRQIAEEAIGLAGLSDRADAPVSQLSGGERQRAYLAMMLAQQAQVMLLDEPTAYLDLSRQFELLALLRKLCEEGLCVLAVLHDLGLAMSFADDLIVMDGGRIAQRGSARQIYDSGVLERVFSVRVRAVDGQYLFSSKN